ncbi:MULTISPECIES: parallel beta-helix domain-containing protein [unclassified Marinobacter]|uniref:parallel beta-helix domain-containing protein n=1 Tax=unclassified Marinobacter TaxID=83889 RepID=UPI0012688894|nr:MULTISPECIES: parallel beta-helix domain-containing protein [unclassified Marinobacter]QFS87767.1 hypothetical protein FIV08_13120 [Marinobacter sp. THAF197a]QFT51552.1 hypothetical protein FIU96_13030 [Marinobacter sp. THAF39]
MIQRLRTSGFAVLGISAVLLLSGCFGGSSGNDRTDANRPGQETEQPPRFSEGRVFQVAPGEQATEDMVAAMIQLRPGDSLEFGCGYFELYHGLLIQATEDVEIRGCGKDETVLNFRNSDNVTGLEVLNVRGITVKDLTILDSPGDAFKLKGVKWGTLLNVRAIWSGGGEPITRDNVASRLHVECTSPPFNEGDPTPDYVPSASSGRYGIYPVESENILVDNSESIGASDAGIYVGQTNNAIIRNSRAAYNVMGFEIENVQGGEYDSNLAECNTGGFLIYDLENITQYGDTSVMLNNISRNNNTYNFAPSGIVSAVPRGTGFITLGYDNIEIYNNLFEDNSTAAIIYTSYELIDGKGKTSDKKLDPYTEGLHIHNNVMKNSGYDLPPPNLEKVLVEGEVETVLPTLIGIKNINRPGKGAHIVWDGLLDELDADCPYPVDANGQPVPKKANGKPIHTNEHPNPECLYNAYKFDNQGNRKLPEWGACIHSNEFSSDSLAYMNFHGTRGLELLFAAMDPDPSLLSWQSLSDILTGPTEFFADSDMSVHDCQARFGRTLASLPRVTIPPFERSGGIDPAPSEEFINQLCEAPVADGQINREALAVDCPRLDQYNLFADAQDPRSMPHEGGVPFVLNSKLFSDYATKYRVAFIPPGTKALYVDGQNGGNLNGTIHFPTGTVIAKTFAFTDESKGTEELVETRLLIKRTSQSGKAVWSGPTYSWTTDANGQKVAKLVPGGETRSVSWHYQDQHTGKLLAGSTDSYAIPNQNQCITCHSNDDQEAGAAPIGPKPRNLNRAYRPESEFMGTAGQGGFPRVNQLQYWKDQGLLANAPPLQIDGRGVATNIERLPHWNVPGDSGAASGSDEDVEARLRAYLEVNCQHCHNDKGAASNTGYYLDHYRKIDAGYGICKKPTATGGGSCGRQHVVVPGDPGRSIVSCRVEDASDPQRKMPPIAKSVSHTEAVELLNYWIGQVVDSGYDNAEACGGSGIFQSITP